MNTFIPRGQTMSERGRCWRRAGIGAVLGAALGAAALSVGPERHSYAESLATMGLVAAPGYLLMGLRLARQVERERPLTRTQSFAVVLQGAALGLVNLLAVGLLLAPFAGAYVIMLVTLFFVPMLVGGAGLGIGCLFGADEPREENR
jgi:hypothetical protein